MTLSELQKKYNLTDEEIVDIANEQLGMSKTDAYFVLSIEKGKRDGDVVFSKSGKAKSNNADTFVMDGDLLSKAKQVLTRTKKK